MRVGRANVQRRAVEDFPTEMSTPAQKRLDKTIGTPLLESLRRGSEPLGDFPKGEYPFLEDRIGREVLDSS